MSSSTADHRPNREIECLRGIAVLFVFIHHLPGLLLWTDHSASTYATGLWVGVDMFFAISGFVITRSLIEQLEHAQGEAFWRQTIAFWIRRAWRILPTAWLWLALPLAWIMGNDMIQHQPTFDGQYSDVIAAVLQVANFHYASCSADPTMHCGGFPPYWSLSLEEQFYLLFPFIILLARQRTIWVLALLAAVQIPLHRMHWQGLIAFVRTDAISLGVCVALLSRRPIYRVFEPTFLRGWAQPVFACVLITAAATVARYQVVPFFLGLTAIVCALAVWAASYDKGYLFRGAFTLRVLGWFGARSFAIYLCQIPCFWVVQAMWRHHAPAAGFSGAYFLRFFIPTALLIALFAELNYRFVETPLRRKGRAIAARFAQARLGDAPAGTATAASDS